MLEVIIFESKYQDGIGRKPCPLITSKFVLRAGRIKDVAP